MFCCLAFTFTHFLLFVVISRVVSVWAERKYYGDPLRCKSCAKEYLLSPSDRAARVALLPPSALQVPTGPDERQREEFDAECLACRKKRAIKLLNGMCPNLSDPDPLALPPAPIATGPTATPSASPPPPATTATPTLPPGLTALASPLNGTAPLSSGGASTLSASPPPIASSVPVPMSLTPATQTTTTTTTTPKPIASTANGGLFIGGVLAPVPVPRPLSVTTPNHHGGTASVSGTHTAPPTLSTAAGAPSTGPSASPVPVFSPPSITTASPQPPTRSNLPPHPPHQPYNPHTAALSAITPSPRGSPPNRLQPSPNHGGSSGGGGGAPSPALLPISTYQVPNSGGAAPSPPAPLHVPPPIVGSTFGGYSPYPNGPPPPLIPYPSAVANPYQPQPLQPLQPLPSPYHQHHTPPPYPHHSPLSASRAGSNLTTPNAAAAQALSQGASAAAAKAISIAAAHDDPTLNTGEGTQSLFGKRFKSVPTATQPQFRPENDAFRPTPHKQQSVTGAYIVMPVTKK